MGTHSHDEIIVIVIVVIVIVEIINDKYAGWKMRKDNLYYISLCPLLESAKLWANRRQAGRGCQLQSTERLLFLFIADWLIRSLISELLM